MSSPILRLHHCEVLSVCNKTKIKIHYKAKFNFQNLFSYLIKAFAKVSQLFPIYHVISFQKHERVGIIFCHFKEAEIQGKCETWD